MPLARDEIGAGVNMGVDQACQINGHGKNAVFDYPLIRRAKMFLIPATTFSEHRLIILQGGVIGD